MPDLVPPTQTSQPQAIPPRDRAGVNTVPLVVAIIAFFASAISSYIAFRSSSAANQIAFQLQENRKAEFASDAERQYVALFYEDFLTTDARRQKAALSLLEVLQPSTAAKLSAWAKHSGGLFPENAGKLAGLDRSITAKTFTAKRYRVFVHVYRPQYPVGGGRSQIEAVLSDDGFTVEAEPRDRYIAEPRVDYFFDDDLEGATRVASLLNALRGPQQQSLAPHKQKGNNPPGTLGVWYR